jgi:hypothetical protein
LPAAVGLFKINEIVGFKSQPRFPRDTPMPITVTCTSCNATLRAPDAAAGKQIKCPKCQSVISIPASTTPDSPVTPAVPPPAPPVPEAGPPMAGAAPPRSDFDDRPRRRRDFDDDDRDDRRRWRRRDLPQGDGTAGGNAGLSMGLGIGAIALGLLAAVFSLIPCCGAFVAWPAGGIGLLLALIGLLMCFLAKPRNVAAIVINSIGSVVNLGAIGFATLWFIWFYAQANASVNSANRMMDDANRWAQDQQDRQRQEQRQREQKLENEKTLSLNNLKQLALAMQLYHDKYKKLPNPIWGGAGGKGKLSWRVALLPYLEHQALYNQFKLDESWDSVANRAILDKEPMPAVFATPKGNAGKNTFYQVITGPKTIWPDAAKTQARLTDITDGTTNTFLIVEAGTSVEWTRPIDVVYDGITTPQLGGIFHPDFCVAFADGSVGFVRRPGGTHQPGMILNDMTLRSLITATGGEAIAADAATGIERR